MEIWKRVGTGWAGGWRWLALGARVVSGLLMLASLPGMLARHDCGEAPAEGEARRHELAARGHVRILVESRTVDSFPDPSLSYQITLYAPGRVPRDLLSGRCQVQDFKQHASGTQLPSGRLALVAWEDLFFELPDGSFARTTLSAVPQDGRAREALRWVARQQDLWSERRTAAVALALLGDREVAPVLQDLLDQDGESGQRWGELAAAHARVTRDPKEIRDLLQRLRKPETLREVDLVGIASVCAPDLEAAAPRLRAEAATRDSSFLTEYDQARARCARLSR